MDNARHHKSILLQQEIKENKNILLYTVAYHSENNSIKEIFSELKHYIRKKSPQNYNEIRKEIIDILKTKIKRKHLENYFKHSFRIYN